MFVAFVITIMKTSKWLHVLIQKKAVTKLMHIIGYFPSSINLKDHNVSEAGSASIIR
jgi:uncharacterized protein YbgA (DUF1722 family)